MGEREENRVASTGGAPRALFCDTNVLVRLLTDDPPAQARAAARVLDMAADGRFSVLLTDVVVAELAYVLTEVYRLPKLEAGERLTRIFDLPGVAMADEAVLRAAVDVWVWGRLDFADAYLAALAGQTKDAGVLTFDRDFDRIPGVVRVDPGALARRV